MKIIDLTTPVKPSEVVKVKKVTYLGEYVLRILFSDGHENAVGSKSFLKRATHPSIKKYLNEDKFKNFKLIHGNLNWNDYGLIFPIEHLYRGNIN